MSTKAYKLIEIKTAPDPTFNLSAHYNLAMRYGNDNDGIITFEKEELADGLATETGEELEVLQAILKDMDGQSYVEYCRF